MASNSNVALANHTDMCCTIKLRTAERTDLRSVSNLEARIYNENERWGIEDFRADFSLPGRHYLVAQCGEEIVGYAAVCEDDDSGVCEITMLTVDPSHRRKGIASRFMDAMLMWCDDRDAEQVRLQMRTGNREAAPLYKSYGFVHDLILKNYYARGADAIEMSKSLN